MFLFNIPFFQTMIQGRLCRTFYRQALAILNICFTLVTHNHTSTDCMHHFLLLLAISLSFMPAGAQEATPDSSHTQAIKQAIALYHQATDDQSPLYSGPEHVGYPPIMTGSAYFGTGEWQNGSVNYDGIWYQNVPMIYDQVRDKVVIRHFNTFYKIELTNDIVDRFTIGSHSFVNLKTTNKSGTPKPGIYEVLVPGKLTLLSRTEKLVDEFIEGNEVRRRIKENTVYYALADSTYHTVANLHSLFTLFGNQKKEVQQHLRKNKIRLKRKSGQAMIKAAEYYNQLTR